MDFRIGQQVMFVNPTKAELQQLMFVIEDNDSRVLVATYWPNSSFAFVLNTYLKTDIQIFNSEIPGFVQTLLSEKISSR
jgi:hypothetical protein